MEINQTIKPNLQIRAFYLFFIIASIQIGVGIIGAPRFIYMESERDSWIAIIIAFVYICIVAWVMLLILKQYQNADFFGIHVDIFGKWVGKLFGTVLIIYLGASFLSILLTYIEVVQIFLYHTLPNLLLTILLMIIVMYAVLGGFRVVVGVSFVFFILTFWLLIVLYDPFMRMNWFNLMPVFNSSFTELLKGAKATSYTLAGFEILLIVYPFIQNKEKAKLPIFLGLAFSSLVLLIITVISIGYFSPVGLKSVDWALLILVKSASFTFIERLDYIVIVVWMMVIIPNLALIMWSMTYGLKRLYKVRQRFTLYIITLIVLVTVNFFQYDYQISNLTDLVAKIGFWIIYVYPFILLPIVLIKKRIHKNKSGDAS
jgi:spore germination protein AB